MSTFNGWTIVTLPTFPPAPKTIEWQAQDTVAENTSPFSGQQQIYNWQASWLEASVTYQPMNNAQAQAWIAFLMALQGTANIFGLGDPLMAAPLGSGAGAPQVLGSSQTGYTLNTKGWTASAQGVLQPGDWLQLGLRLYRNLSVANADGSGDATLNIWPQIRESPVDGTNLVLNNTQGLFRLKSNQRKWSVNDAKIYGITFEMREAI
jgi:hypothetical protein